MTSPDISAYSEYENAEPVESHDGGEFWSAVLWDIRNASGISTGQADWLVYASTAAVSGNPTFSEYRDAIIDEDNAEYGGQHVCTIEDVFFDRGIGGPCVMGPSNLVITNAGQTGEAPSLSWTGSSTSGVSYKVYRCESYYQSCASTETVIGTTSSTSYTDFGVTITTQGSATDRYTYRVTAVLSGSESGSTNSASVWGDGVQKRNKDKPFLPEAYFLSANYPNPFNPSTEIRFALPEAARVDLVVYDVLGREVARLVDGTQEAGHHRAPFDASALPSGVYLYRLTAGDFVETRRMVLMK
jgi:hypothetical protein